MMKIQPRRYWINLFLLGLGLWSIECPVWGQSGCLNNPAFSSICTVDAGPDFSTCPQGVVRLSGTLGGMATGGSWNDGGAGGSFVPNANTPNAFYVPPSPNPNDSIALVFTATGPCVPVTDTMLIFYGTLPPLILTAVPDSAAFCGKQLTFHIMAMDGFKNISSLQYNLNWDPSQLTFVRDTALRIGGAYPGIGAFNTASGSLTYTWFDLAGSEGEDLPDSTELLSITLKVLPGTDTAKVNITGSPAIIEATNSQYCVLQVQINQGAQQVRPVEVTCPPDSVVHLNAPPILLSAGIPAGGVYSGTGVSGDIFDPMAAGLGVHLITYMYADTNHCANACSFNITVNELPTVTCPADLSLCMATPPFLLTGAMPTGGTYSGTGVQANVFDPAKAGAGTHTITYTYDNNLSCSFTITVIPPLVLNLAHVTNESCTVGFDGAIDLNVSSGTPGYSYDWSNNGIQDPDIDPQDISGLTAGIYTVTVTDGSNCTASLSVTLVEKSCPEISGKLIWEADRLTLMTGIEQATVTLSGDDDDTDFTGVPGTYLLQVTSGSNFVVTPLKNEPMPDAISSLSAADASRIRQHISGAFLLADPYKIIAADPNESDLVSSEDAFLVQKSLLGDPLAQDFFIQNTWRFVPKAYVFPTPADPWGFPEKINIIGINNNLTDLDFIGIKKGEVINPANNSGGTMPNLVWKVKDQILEQDGMVVVEFRTENFDDLLALQFGIWFDPAKLAFIGLDTVAGNPFQEDNFGFYKLASGEIRTVLALAQTLSLTDGTPCFRLKFKSLQNGGKLSEVLQFNNAVLRSEAYAGDYTPGPVNLIFEDVMSGTDDLAGAVVTGMQIHPNPFRDETTIGFFLPKDSEVQIRILDGLGCLVFEHKGLFFKGYNSKTIHLKGYSAYNSMLYGELITAYGTWSKKMFRINE